jgi:hypothetical protein
MFEDYEYWDEDDCQQDTYTLTVKAKTNKALLLSDGKIEEWFPISRLGFYMELEEVKVGNEYEFVIENWIAYDKGLC